MLTLIIDLDNTIYPVKSIGDKLFGPLFRLLEEPEYRLSKGELETAKNEIMRRPFQNVAEEHGFSKKLIDEALILLRELTYDGEMYSFEEYNFVKQLPVRRFLLTTGFTKLQQSKIAALGISSDYEEVFIVDPDKQSETKKEVIERIIRKYTLDPAAVLIVGDDPESEIQAASDLGLQSFLLDTHDRYPDDIATYKGRTLKDLQKTAAIKRLRN
ncbi:MAG TPA: HAD family hydrolase [Sphingobacteriaceae bacterium]